MSKLLQHFGGQSLKCGGAATLQGYLDEFRISTGVARWTRNFSPVSQPNSSPSVTHSGSDFTVDFWIKAMQKKIRLSELIQLPGYTQLFSRMPLITLPKKDAWYHVAVVRSDHKCHLFINGNKQNFKLGDLTPEEEFEQALENL